VNASLVREQDLFDIPEHFIAVVNTSLEKNSGYGKIEAGAGKCISDQVGFSRPEYIGMIGYERGMHHEEAVRR